MHRAEIACKQRLERAKAAFAAHCTAEGFGHMLDVDQRHRRALFLGQQLQTDTDSRR